MNDLVRFLENKKLVLAAHKKISLRLKIIPNAGKTEWKELLVCEDVVTVKLRVAAVPVKGKANKVIEKFVGDFFGARAEIVRGHTSGLKLVKVSKI